MKLVICGLTLSSTWGNGHATLWRGLTAALQRRGVATVFFERDLPHYATHRDQKHVPGGTFVLYSDWSEAAAVLRWQLADADVAIVTSSCPDGRAASELVLQSSVGLKVFYDLDSAVTLRRHAANDDVGYLPERGLQGFDLVLSATGGEALGELEGRLGAFRVAPLYPWVDADRFAPQPPRPEFRGDLSYLETDATERQSGLTELFLEPARAAPERRFVLGGAPFPADLPWSRNIHHVRSVPPGDHPAFLASSRLSLSLTRRSLQGFGYCPPLRLFEAAASGAAVVSDGFMGLERFFKPNEEVLVAKTADDVLNALEASEATLSRLRTAARERVLTEHTALHRADELLLLLEHARETAHGRHA